MKEAVETIVDGAKAMVSPEFDSPINMPHNESGAEIERAAKRRNALPRKLRARTRSALHAPPTSGSTSPRLPTRPQLFPARKQKRSASHATANKRVARAKKAAPKTSKKNAKKSTREDGK